MRGTAPAEAIAKGVAALARVPGRFERVDCGQPFTVVVDYAHTDDALAKSDCTGPGVRATGRAERARHHSFRLRWRSRPGQAPMMGEAAGRGSDFVVLTSDNPRSEDPLAIINDAMVGLQRSGAKYKTEPDRKAAIALAVCEAGPGDIVLIAGKGHEKVQVTRAGAIPFDDVRSRAENSCERQVTTASPRTQLPGSVHETSALPGSPSSCRLLASSTIKAIAQAYSIDSRTIRPENFSSP